MMFKDNNLDNSGKIYINNAKKVMIYKSIDTIKLYIMF